LGAGLGLPFQPLDVRVGAAWMAAPPNFVYGLGPAGWEVCSAYFFAPNPQTGGYFTGWSDLGGLLELL
jgi:hypothetical protein